MNATVLALVTLLAAPAAGADPSALPARPSVQRKGFSLEFGIGYGAIFVSGLDRFGAEKHDRGFEPHALSLGGFLTNDLALFYRWKSTYHGTKNARRESSQRFLGTHTANLQAWVHDLVFVGGGVGLAMFGHGFGKSRDDPAWTYGGGIDLRVGFALYAWKHHLISLSHELVAGFFRHGSVLGITVNLSYQYF